MSNVAGRKSPYRRIAAVLAAVAIFCAMVFGPQFWAKINGQENAPKFNRNGCISDDSKRAKYVVLIDATDKITPLQAKILENNLSEIIETAEEGSSIAVFKILPNRQEPIENIVRGCLSAKVENVNWLEHGLEAWQNERNRFKKLIEDGIREILESSAQRQSPIVEAIHAAEVLEFRSMKSDKKYLFIASDLLQNSIDTTGLNHYGKMSTFDQFRETENYILLSPVLNNVQIKIFYIVRASSLIRQDKNHINWWTEFFNDSKGILNGIERVRGDFGS